MVRVSKFAPEIRAHALKALEGGTPVKDIAAELGIPNTTISNWKAEMNKKNGGGTKKKKSKPTVSIEQELENWKFDASLQELENDALRSMLDVTDDPVRLLTIEIDYLRKRLGLFGDASVKPLRAPAEEPQQESV